MFNLNANQNPTLALKKKLVALFFTLLIPLSSLLSIFGSFTVLDVVIIGFLTLSVAGIKELKIPVMLTSWSLIGILTVISVSLFGLLRFDLSYDALFNAAQMIFILAAVSLAAKECTKYCNFYLLLYCANVLAVLSSLILFISLYIDTPFVFYDQLGRYLPRFTGLTSIYTIVLAFSAFQYLQGNIRLFKFLLMISIVLVGILCSGQRSMMLSFFLVTGFVFFKKNSFFINLLVSIPLISIFILFYGSLFLSLETRVIQEIFLDVSRIEILNSFLSDMYESPMAFFTGFGIERWNFDGQEVHMQIFHLISDYGVFLMLSYFYIVYRFVFFCFDTNTEVRLFAVILTISLLPFVLFHTYSLERGHIFLFILVGAYFSDMKNFRERHCGIT